MNYIKKDIKIGVKNKSKIKIKRVVGVMTPMTLKTPFLKIAIPMIYYIKNSYVYLIFFLFLLYNFSIFWCHWCHWCHTLYFL